MMESRMVVYTDQPEMLEPTYQNVLGDRFGLEIDKGMHAHNN